LSQCGGSATGGGDRGQPSLPRIALYQPDIAGNAGAIMRLGACLGYPVDLIGPTGFDASDRALRRAGMDYIEMATLVRHVDFAAFEAWRRQEARRVVLFTTVADRPFWDMAYRDTDILLFGRESAGVPGAVHMLADERVTIPMPGGGRSLNLAQSAAIGAGEALRQLSAPATPGG
jgi:tRNA (cytidine/uridine-2'-O-)-methyltransferase